MKKADRWLLRKFMWVMLLLGLAACAEKPSDDSRYLTKEEDANLRAQCEKYDPVGGCAAVPVPYLQKMIEALQACRQEHSL